MTTTPVAPPRPLMSLDQVTALLTVLTALDNRFTAPDADTARIRAGVWHKIIGEVDPNYAMRYVEQAYSEPRSYQLQAADIRQAWRADLAAADALADAEYERGLWGDPVPLEETLDYLRRTAAGDEAVGPVPQTGRQQSETAAQRERRCTYHRLCACSHTTCFDGWSDDEVLIRNAAGKESLAVRRCVACADALLMAEEQGIARKPSGGGRRR